MVSELDLQFHRGAVYLPRLGLWLDAHEMRKGPERVLVTHAHSDHIGRHREVISTTATARLMAARIGGNRLLHELSFGQPKDFSGPLENFRVTLLPAGHIYGSALGFLETANYSLLYTGDFKLKPGLSAEVCTPCRADLLVMETTFGRPDYVFPPAEEVWGKILQFVREALNRQEIPVLLAYSLGKSQELLCGLGQAGLPVMLHEQAHKLTRIQAGLGAIFPPHELLDVSQVAGRVVICPPGTNALAELRARGTVRTAVVTGWAIDPGCKYRYQADAAFPLSDHADFPDLLKFVEQVAPRRVYTLHGFAAEFAQSLRERGFDARALGMQEQLQLPLFGRA